jgi:hypothetical protein
MDGCRDLVQIGDVSLLALLWETRDSIGQPISEHNAATESVTETRQCFSTAARPQRHTTRIETEGRHPSSSNPQTAFLRLPSQQV